MSRFSGPQYKGAVRALRALRREEAGPQSPDGLSLTRRLGRKAREGELDPALYNTDGTRRAGVSR